MSIGKFSLGLTGGIGSGKTTVSNMFTELGATIIDTDVIAHQLSEPRGEAIAVIAQKFGAAYIDINGAMDRKKMRELIFADPQAKKNLEAILHPLIRQHCEQAAADAKGAYPIFVVPLLIESGNWRARVQRILVVDCDQDTQIKRVMHRNHFTREQVVQILAAQASRDERLAQADDVIDSMANVSQVRIEVERLHKKYLNLAISR